MSDPTNRPPQICSIPDVHLFLSDWEPRIPFDFTFRQTESGLASFMVSDHMTPEDLDNEKE